MNIFDNRFEVRSGIIRPSDEDVVRFTSGCRGIKRGHGNEPGMASMVSMARDFGVDVLTCRE